MPVERFDRACLAPVPWKNGGGVTREIVCRPAGTGMEGFAWRASIASIAADGPFSVFPGIDRVIVLLDGSGVRLRSRAGDIDHRLETPLVPFAFDGEAEIAGTLLSGESSDFNVMTRRDAVRADVRVLRGAQVLPTCASGVLLAARGTWQIEAHAGAVESPAVSSPGAGLWWDEEPVGWHVVPEGSDAALIAVHVWPRATGRAV